MKPRDYVPNPILGLFCAGCQRFVDTLQLVASARYRCKECSAAERGASA